MTQEQKELVIKDLCCRAPYNTIVSKGYSTYDGLKWVDEPLTLLLLQSIEEEDSWEYVKPYLRSMSSMTEEEKDEMFGICTLSNCSVNTDWEYVGVEIMSSHPKYGDYYSTDYKAIDWLNKKMFDYRGLIPKGLALEATKGMYENESNSENESDSVIDNTTKITVGCKIRSKTNPDVILRIVSDDCHGDEFECSNGSVLSLKQINKYYDLYIEENKGTIVIN